MAQDQKYEHDFISNPHSSSSQPRASMTRRVLAYEVVHVALGLSELHFVHTLVSVPVQECSPSEHGLIKIRHAREHSFHGVRIADERGCHGETFRRDIANANLDVVRDPPHKMGGVFVHNVGHLVVHLLGRHATTEEHSSSEVPPSSHINSTHHVPRVEDLLREFWD